MQEDEEQGFIDLYDKHVEEYQRCYALQAADEGVVDVGQGAELTGHNTIDDAYKTGADGQQGHKAAAEGRREETTGGTEQNGMRNDGEQGYDHEEEQGRQQGTPKGDALTVVVGIVAPQTAPPQAAPRQSDHENPREGRRGDVVGELAEEPAHTFAAEQGTHTAQRRSAENPRDQHQRQLYQHQR